jgi:hypothetical protein
VSETGVQYCQLLPTASTQLLASTGWAECSNGVEIVGTADLQRRAPPANGRSIASSGRRGAGRECASPGPRHGGRGAKGASERRGCSLASSARLLQRQETAVHEAGGAACSGRRTRSASGPRQQGPTVTVELRRQRIAPLGQWPSIWIGYGRGKDSPSTMARQVSAVALKRRSVPDSSVRVQTGPGVSASTAHWAVARQRVASVGNRLTFLQRYRWGARMTSTCDADC